MSISYIQSLGQQPISSSPNMNKSGGSPYQIFDQNVSNISSQPIQTVAEKKALKIANAIRSYINTTLDPSICERENQSINPCFRENIENEFFLDQFGNLLAYKNYGTDIMVLNPSNKKFEAFTGTYEDFKFQYDDIASPFTISWPFRLNRQVSIGNWPLINFKRNPPTKEAQKVIDCLEPILNNLYAGARSLPKNSFHSNPFFSNQYWVKALAKPQKYSSEYLISMAKSQNKGISTPLKNPQSPQPALQSNSTIISHLKSDPLTNLYNPKPNLQYSPPAEVKVAVLSPPIKLISKNLPPKEKPSDPSQNINSLASQTFQQSTNSQPPPLSKKKVTKSCWGMKFLRAIGRLFIKIYRFVY